MINISILENVCSLVSLLDLVIEVPEYPFLWNAYLTAASSYGVRSYLISNGQASLLSDF